MLLLNIYFFIFLFISRFCITCLAAGIPIHHKNNELLFPTGLLETQQIIPHDVVVANINIEKPSNGMSKIQSLYEHTSPYVRVPERPSKNPLYDASLASVSSPIINKILQEPNKKRRLYNLNNPIMTTSGYGFPNNRNYGFDHYTSPLVNSPYNNYNNLLQNDPFSNVDSNNLLLVQEYLHKQNKQNNQNYPTSSGSLLSNDNSIINNGFQQNTNYNTLNYQDGDIPSLYGSYLPATGIRHFNGVWHLMGSRSDSIEDILEALGIPHFKRRIMATYEGTTEIKVSPNADAIFMRNNLPAGKVVEGKILLDGRPFQYKEAETGLWVTRALFTNNRLIQVRQGKDGVMYDVRVVFPGDPEGQVSGPLMLFRLTYVPKNSGIRMSANRWFKKIN